MAFRKPRLALKALGAIVIVFSLLSAYLLHFPFTTFSRDLVRVRNPQPSELTRDDIAVYDVGESLANGDQKQEADVSIDRDNEKHAMQDGATESRTDADQNSNLADGKAFRDTNWEENSSDTNDQEDFESIENVDNDEKEQHEMNNAKVKLPLRLGPSLSHLKRSPTNPLTAPLEWKRPMMLSAIGISHGEQLRLAMFTTGVNLIGFGRALSFIGCLVGNKTYPKLADDSYGPNYCLIDSHVPHGSTISMLIARDEKLEAAMAEPFVVKQFSFEIGEEDLLKLGENVKIGEDIRQLSDGNEIVGIKSNITWHEGLREPEFDPKQKRFEMCLMTSMRQYPFLMQQWFDYYRQMGVDQVYVYDNVSEEDLSQFDSEFVQTGFWPYGRSQYQSFNHFLILARSRCKYVAFLDGDEYIFVGDSKPGALKRYIKKWTSKGYDQIIFPFIVMAGGGHIRRPEGFLPELYVRRNLRQNKFNVGKSIISTDVHYQRHMIHFANKGKAYLNDSFELNPTSLDHNAMLVHYTKRSWEEYIMKTNCGGASVVTNARSPKNLSINTVPKYYASNDSTVEYLAFRDQWRTIMKREEPKDVSLVWEWYGKQCKQRYCIACKEKKLLGKPECVYMYI